MSLSGRLTFLQSDAYPVSFTQGAVMQSLRRRRRTLKHARQTVEALTKFVDMSTLPTPLQRAVDRELTASVQIKAARRGEALPKKPKPAKTVKAKLAKAGPLSKAVRKKKQ